MDLSGLIVLELIIFVVGVLILISLILPWINFFQIKDLQHQIKQLQKQSHKNIEQEIKTPPHVPLEINVMKNIATPVSPHKKPKLNFEQQFGTQFPVWIGGIALALAGFFLVKYSIEKGLLTVNVRLCLGLLFGFALLFFGNWIRSKPNLSNGSRIAQALTGAGIADLYASLFAASNIYGIVPTYISFIGMAIVTFFAILLSLRHGPPIALLGLIGGLLTPLLNQVNTYHTALLFTYLYIIIATLLVLIRQKKWAFLFFPVIIGAFSWVGYWIFFGSLLYTDCLWLYLFLIALAATFVFAFIQEDVEKFPSFKIISACMLCGTIFLMTLIGFKTQLDNLTWSMFGLIAVASIVLSYFKQKLYGFMPWMLMIVNALMFITWQHPTNASVGMIIAIFAAIYCISASVILWRSQNPISWSGLFGVCSVSYFLIGYTKLHQTFLTSNIWGSIALFLAALSIIMTVKILENINFEKTVKQNMLTVFILTISAFVSIGFAILLKKEYLPMTIAFEIFVISWINTKVDINHLRKISGLLLIALFLVLMPEISVFTHLMVDSILRADLLTNFSRISAPFFQFGIPAVLLGGSSIFFGKKNYDDFVKCIEFVSIIFFIFMTYCFIRYGYHHFNTFLLERAQLTERNIINNILFLYGILFVWAGQKFSRAGISQAGLMLISIILARVIYFDLVLYNPLWTHEWVGNLPVFNSLLLAYGLPTIGIVLTLKIQQRKDISSQLETFLEGISIFSLFLLFVFISLNVRQFYHGEYLDSHTHNTAEIYTYSVAWLLLGIGLLFAGTITHHKSIRIASLVVMMLTVGKVFLYDASQLTGLLRVFSFLGLGLSLIILSWFYTRFVFKTRKAE